MHDAKGIHSWMVAWRDGMTQCATTVTAAACSRLHYRPGPLSSLSHEPQPHMQPMERDLALAVKQPSHGCCSCSCQRGLLLRAQCKQLARIGVVESSRCPQVRPWRQKAAASSLWHRGGCVWLCVACASSVTAIQPTVECTTPRASPAGWLRGEMARPNALPPRCLEPQAAFTTVQSRPPASTTGYSFTCSRD